MRIFTKKAFIFFNPDDGDKALVTKALAFDDVPEWVKHDPTFKAGVADGDIEELVTREQQIKAEKGITDPVEPAKAKPAKK